MTRVLQICNKAPYPPNDGSSIAIYNMAEGFIANDTSLHLLTINTKKHFKEDKNIPENFRKQTHYRSVFRNTDVNAMGAIFNLFSSDSYFVSRFYFQEFEQAIIDTLQKNEFDIIQLEGLFVAGYIPAIRKFSKAKIVLRAHNIEYLIWERHLKNEKSVLKKMYLNIQTQRLKAFELKVLNEVDAIVTITDVDKDYFKELGCKKPIYTCITGVNVAQYKEKSSTNNKQNTLFHFASMDWMPNVEAVDWLLENCWKKIHEQCPEAKLVLAGRYMPEKFLKMNLPNVQVIEKVQDSGKFYKENGIMLVPLLSGSGLRIKLIEGMAYGKAIVSTSIGAEGIKYTTGKNILIADTPAEFVKAVVSILKDETLKQNLEREAQQFSENEFDNKKVVSGLIKFYTEIKNV